MNCFTPFKWRLAVTAGIVTVTAAVSALFLPLVYAGDGKTVKPPAATTTAKEGLSGADLYAMHCNRCHAERYPKEFTSGQWKTLMIHMRVRANLPAAQANEILKYLQQESGN